MQTSLQRLYAVVIYLLSLALISHCDTTLAANDLSNWQTCAEIQNSEVELSCYRKVAQENSATEKPHSLMAARAHGLAQEWAPNNDPLTVYKQNYLLVYSHTNQTNNSPTSPNPQNQVLTPYPMDNRDMKFQISIKHDLADFHRYGSLWFGYTQLSFWQFYDVANSRPFRENNYEPELIYSLRPNDIIRDFKLNPSIFNIGLVHQSNGQSNPRSRSWNRVYVQPGIEHNYGGDHRLVLLARWWQRINEDVTTDDNPDINHFLGNGDIELRYSQNSRWEISLLAKSRSIQLDLAAPWTAWRLLTLAAPGEHNTNIHLQYFSGYGESLIDYNHKHETWGVGLSFPFE